MTRLNWSSRQSPTDLDEGRPDATQAPEFDYTHKGGASPWPERHKFTGIKFGPALLKRAWRDGLVVIAYIDGFPNPVAVKEARWFGGVFQVGTLEGWKIPTRIKTTSDIGKLRSTGEYIE